MSKQEVLASQQQYVEWLDSLNSMSEQQAAEPYAEGKWSPKEIVMHLAEWDRFTLEERLSQMKEGSAFERFPDFEAFNAEAAALAHQQTFEETVAYAKKQRQDIIQRLQQIAEEEWQKPFTIGKAKLTIESYFTDFAEHDVHHMQQIESIRQ